MSKSDQSVQKSRSMCDIPDAVPTNVAVYSSGHDFSTNRRQSRTCSDSSVDIVVADSDSDGSARAQLADSGLPDQSAVDGQALAVLERKIDRLCDMFQEQCRLLTVLKEDIRNSKAAVEKVEEYQTDILADFVKKTVFQGFSPSSNVREENRATDASEPNSRAQSLLNAIEVRQGSSMDREVKDALASFLQSEELKQHMVSATAESVRGVVGECLARDLAALYLPVIEHSQRRLVRQLNKTVEDAFNELEENSACLSRSVYKISRSLRRSMDRHQHLLEATADPNKNVMATLKCTVEELLHKELQQWRQKVLEVFIERAPDEAPEPPPLESAPPAPLQPHPDHSIIDQLMMVAEIHKQIEAGDVNGAFEVALNAGDLALVRAACRRAAAPRAPRRPALRQPVLLALLQQLSTDMLHDTQLNCRYLEESILNLDPSNVVTRAHLPLIVGEVRKHLSNFVASYPSHVASRRIALIIMAAENLLK